jgi:epoxyqueuosine reductase QueG
MVSNIGTIKAKAKTLGFSFVGFTEIQQSPHFPDYLKWLKKEQYGHLEFLNQHYVIESRRKPQQLLRGARSVIVLRIQYGPLPKRKHTESSNNQ